MTKGKEATDIQRIYLYLQNPPIPKEFFVVTPLFSCLKISTPAHFFPFQDSTPSQLSPQAPFTSRCIVLPRHQRTQHHRGRKDVWDPADHSPQPFRPSTKPLYSDALPRPIRAGAPAKEGREPRRKLAGGRRCTGETACRRSGG